jgi:hypothetical protein
MNAEVLRKAPILEIRRSFRLPIQGRVLVSEGANVHFGDVVAEAKVMDDLLVVDIARALSVSAGETDQCLLRRVGETLEAGDIIAQTEGAFPRLVRTPMKGVFLECFEGKATFAVGHHLIQLQAGMTGKVESVIPEWGVTLRTKGSLLQGVWGNGKVAEGILSLSHLDQPSTLDEDFIGSLEAGQIVVTGACLSVDVWEKLIEKDISGLICCTFSPGLISGAMEAPIPVLVLQGFGDLPVDEDAYGILQSRSGASACVNASFGRDFLERRPEVIIPITDGNPEEDLGTRAKLAPGQRVQILAGKYAGEIGELVELSELPTTFEGCHGVSAARVFLRWGDVVQVPSQNLAIVSMFSEPVDSPQAN